MVDELRTTMSRHGHQQAHEGLRKATRFDDTGDW